MLILSGESQLTCRKVIKSFPILCTPPLPAGSTCSPCPRPAPAALPTPHTHTCTSPPAFADPQPKAETNRQQARGHRDCPCCVPFPCHSTPTLPSPYPIPTILEHPLSFHASMTSHMLFSPRSPPLRVPQSLLASSGVISSVKPPSTPPSSECTPLLGAH